MKGSRTFVEGKVVFKHEGLCVEYDASKLSCRLVFQNGKGRYEAPDAGTGEPIEAIDLLGECLALQVKLNGFEPTEIHKGISRFHLEAKKFEEEPIELEHLIQIENPDYAGKLVKVQAVMASNSVSYSIPFEYEASCSNNSDRHNCVGTASVKLSIKDLPLFVDITDSARNIVCKNLTYSFGSGCFVTIKHKQSATIKRLRVRPVVQGLAVKEVQQEGKSKKVVVDKLGHEYKSYDIYVQNIEVQAFEIGRTVVLTGYVIPDPKSQKVSLAVKSVEMDTSQKYDIDNVKALKEFFAGRSINDILDWVTIEFEKYSRIIKRYTITIADLLTACSCIQFSFDGKLITGWLKILILGDTTTAKSDTAFYILKLLGVGEMITAETASVVGIAATAIQTQAGWFVEYGSLILQDRGLLVIDGFHKLSKQATSDLAESERTGIYKVRKAAKGDANARTRRIDIANAIGDDRSVRELGSFYYSAESLMLLLEQQSIARRDLVVFVRAKDVIPDDVNKNLNEPHDKKLEYLSDLVKLIWQQEFEIIFDNEAKEIILDSATLLYNKFYVPSIPVCAIDLKYKLAKLSIAIAGLTCSFDEEFKQLIVTKQHVEYVVNLLINQYNDAGLDRIAKRSKESEVDKDDLPIVLGNIKTSLEHKEPEVSIKVCEEILEFVATQPKFTREQLKVKFSLAKDNELLPLIASLQNQELLEHTSRGFTASKKCIELARLLLKGRVEPIV